MSVSKRSGKKRKHGFVDRDGSDPQSAITVPHNGSVQAKSNDVGILESTKSVDRAAKRVKPTINLKSDNVEELAKSIAYNRHAEKLYKREQAVQKASTLDALEAAMEIMNAEQSINRIKQIDPEGFLLARKKGTKKQRLAKKLALLNGSAQNTLDSNENGDLTGEVAIELTEKLVDASKGVELMVKPTVTKYNTSNNEQSTLENEVEQPDVTNKKKSKKEKTSSRMTKDQFVPTHEEMHKETTLETSTKKRKKADDQELEIEIDVDLPEPPSKKEARKARKTQKKNIVDTKSESNVPTQRKASTRSGYSDVTEKSMAIPTAIKKADETQEGISFGIWVANLPYSLTKSALKAFFSKSGINESDILRVNLSAPQKSSGPSQKNRGFAYVDFGSKASHDKAIQLHDTLIVGRQVMIKDSKDFEGRPAKRKDDTGTTGDENPPSNRIHVKNLPFEANTEMLRSLFEPCGAIANVFVATFEDNQTKCKGYAWVTFEELESASAAVRGWVEGQDDASKKAAAKDESIEIGAKPKKSKKKAVNRLLGRELQISYAEDDSIRYSKRFGVPKVNSKAKNIASTPQKKEAKASTSRPTEQKVPVKSNISPPESPTASSIISSSSSAVSSLLSSPASTPSVSRAATPIQEEGPSPYQNKRDTRVFRRILEHTVASNRALERRQKKAVKSI